MARILYILLAALALPAHADVWEPYDGASGITCTQYNDAAKMAWKSRGGDIGPAADTIKQAIYVGKLNSLNITKVMRADGFAIKGNRIYNVSSKEGPAPPRLIVTLPDTTIALDPIADVGISCTTTSATGRSATLKFGQADPVLFFFPPVPANAVSASLEFTPSKSYSGPAIPTWTLHSVTIPRPPQSDAREGIAAGFVNDAGIRSHPSVLWATGLEPGEPHATRCPLSPTPVHGFVPASGNAWQNTIRGTAEGAKGTFEHCALPETYFRGASWDNITPGSEFRELFMRMELRFGSNYRDISDVETLGGPGGKLPLGMAAGYKDPGRDADYCGGGGTTCEAGDRGWTARGGYTVINDPKNPAYAHVQGHQYVYHYQQPGTYGRFVPWNALFALDRWYTVEMQIIVNDPGQANGVMRFWVDGRLTREVTGMQLRGPTTLAAITAKGGQQLIRSVWPVWFHGGKKPPSHSMTGWADNIVVATEYIGPRRQVATVSFPGPYVCRVGQQPVCQ